MEANKKTKKKENTNNAHILIIHYFEEEKNILTIHMRFDGQIGGKELSITSSSYVSSTNVHGARKISNDKK